MAGSLAGSLAPELVRLVSEDLYEIDVSGYGVVAMRLTCTGWRRALASSEKCWRTWTLDKFPLVTMSANIGFLGDGRDYFKTYCTQLRAESPPRPRRSKNEAYSINVLMKSEKTGESILTQSMPLHGDLGDGFASITFPPAGFCPALGYRPEPHTRRCRRRCCRPTRGCGPPRRASRTPTPSRRGR